MLNNVHNSCPILSSFNRFDCVIANSWEVVCLWYRYNHFDSICIINKNNLCFMVRVNIKETRGDRRRLSKKKKEAERRGNVGVSQYSRTFSITDSDLSSCLLSLSFQSNSKSLCWYKREETDVAKAFTSQPGSSLRFFPWLSSHWGASVVDQGIPEISRASCRLLAYQRIGRRTSINTLSHEVGKSK